MNNNETKLKLYRMLGSELGHRSGQILSRAFKIKTRRVSFGEMTNICRNNIGLTPILYDREFYLTDWATWEQLIKYDWADRKKYLIDKRDCDNFANSFNSRMAEIYGLNSAGRFTNVMVYKNGSSVPHRATVIVTSNNSMYALEPQDDLWAKIEKGKPVIIGGREYKYDKGLISFN